MYNILVYKRESLALAIIVLLILGRHIESNTGKSARQGNLRHPKDFISHFDKLFLVSCLFDSYVLLADDHVHNVS